MERLTEKVFAFGTSCMQIKACGNDTCAETCKKNKSCEDCPIKITIEKLADYEDLEEQGKLLKLPCAVGDMVYTNHSVQGWYFKRKDLPYKAKVVYIGISNGINNYINVDFGNGHMLQFKCSDIGKTVFLTRTEAEQALAETENNSIDEIREMAKDCCCKLRVPENFEEDKNNGQAD